LDYFEKYADVEAKVSASTRDRIVEKINFYNNLRDSINAHIEAASMGDLYVTPCPSSERLALMAA
jgi:hypothetical protein